MSSPRGMMARSSEMAFPPTLAEALRSATSRLVEAGIPAASTDARLLLCAAAEIDRVALLRNGDSRLSRDSAAILQRFLDRRLDREPVSRILGRREFWGLDLLVTPDVLDPRADTETLVEAALTHVGRGKDQPWRILDLGTGSGAILCALLSELPAASGLGVDRSFVAARVARDNLRRCGLGARALVIQADWGASLRMGGFDLVVSNPPYIETPVIATLDEDVRRYDPRVALDGGADGLDAYRAIRSSLPDLLAPGGGVFLEVGAGQAHAVARLLQSTGLGSCRTHRDLAGVDRVLAASGPGVHVPTPAAPYRLGKAAP